MVMRFGQGQYNTQSIGLTHWSPSFLEQMGKIRLISVFIGELHICSRYSDVLYGGCSLWENHCSTANPGSASQPTSTGGLNVAALLILHFVLPLLYSSCKPYQQTQAPDLQLNMNYSGEMKSDLQICKIYLFLFSPSFGLALLLCK